MIFDNLPSSAQAVPGRHDVGARLCPLPVRVEEELADELHAGAGIDEVSAIQAVFDPGRQRPLYVGSAKANLGHMESAAGVGVIPASRIGERPVSRVNFVDNFTEPSGSESWKWELIGRNRIS